MKNSIYILLLVSLVLISCDREVTVTPPDEPPPDGYVFLDSNPEGSQIYLQGKNRRRSTPDSITWLETGTYEFTLKKDFFNDTSIVIDVVEGERQSIFVDYTKNPRMLGDLILRSKPEACKIYFDGEFTGYETPHRFNSLLPGYYTVTYKKEDYEHKTFVTTVKSSFLRDTSVTLIDTTVWHYYNAENSGLHRDKLSAVAVDHNNTVWIATQGKGISAYDGNSFIQYDVGNSRIAGNAVSGLTVDANNNVWISTYTGVSYVNNGFFVSFESGAVLPPYPINSISVRLDNTIFNNTVWMTNNTQVISTSFDPEFGRGWKIIGVSDGLSSTPFGEITVDGSGRKWVATESSGVLALYNNQEFRFYNTSNSTIPSNRVKAVAARGSEIWVACSSLNNTVGGGIAYYDGYDWNRIVPANNLADRDVREIYIDSKNRVWFASPRGVFVIINKTEIEVLDIESTGIDLSTVVGITEDQNGFMWFATSDRGIYHYKRK